MDNAVYNNIKEDEPVNVGVPQVATGGAIIAPSGAPFKGNASVIPSKFSQSGINQVAVGIGNSIQDAINAMHSAGGGKVFLGAGTHIVTTPLAGYTGVDIEGENQSTTIIDFNSTSANLSFAGTDVYTTGTITSISGGVNVTGSSTSWLTNVTTDHQIFIGNTWYKIAVVLTDTTLTLAEGYQGNATLPGAAYRAAKIQRDVDIKDITLKSSTGTALVATDCRNFSLKNVKLDTNNKGFVFTNVSEFISEQILSVSNTSNGGELTNTRLCNLYNLATPGNGGHGFVLNNVETGVIMESSSNSNTSDGYNLTSCSNLVMSPVEASSNGGQGVELVSGNNNISINGIMNANTSDGIKLTATSDNCKISGCKITNNGGYGVNVAASSCDNNLISTSFFDNNSSGNKNDSGTGTLWTANIPDSLNTGGSPAGSKAFGGDGSDGALSISSGTTTLNMSNATTFVKNYSSISITGTASLAFSNPATAGTIIRLKSEGDVTITSSSASAITVVGMGAAGGNGCTLYSCTAASGTNSGEVQDALSHQGVGGIGSTNVSGGAGGNGGAAENPLTNYTTATKVFYRKSIILQLGSGGGGGGGSGNDTLGGVGGAGGGILIIECAGAFNFTTGTITAAGADGAGGFKAGGGGGSGGSILILYGTLTANSGTISVAGGAGGVGDSPLGGRYGGGGGGGGGGYSGAGSNGTAGGLDNAGDGGAGANGFSLVAQNTEWA